MVDTKVGKNWLNEEMDTMENLLLEVKENEVWGQDLGVIQSCFS